MSGSSGKQEALGRSKWRGAWCCTPHTLLHAHDSAALLQCQLFPPDVTPNPCFLLRPRVCPLQHPTPRCQAADSVTCAVMSNPHSHDSAAPLQSKSLPLGYMLMPPPSAPTPRRAQHPTPQCGTADFVTCAVMSDCFSNESAALLRSQPSPPDFTLTSPPFRRAQHPTPRCWTV